MALANHSKVSIILIVIFASITVTILLPFSDLGTSYFVIFAIGHVMLGIGIWIASRLRKRDYHAGKCYNCKSMKNIRVMRTDPHRLYNKCPNCPALPEESSDEHYDYGHGAPHSRYDA